MTSTPARIHQHVRDGVAVLVIDNPPVNALGAGVWEAIGAAIAAASAAPDVAAVVLTGAGRTFVAGADISVFDTFRTGDDAMARSARTHGVLRAMEDSPKPVVAAIHGHAFGGGLELAMGCHFRVATADALFGQLEVQLGIIPGAGGTQRLPRLCGAPLAIDMCTTGRVIPVTEAAAAGLIDAVIAGPLVDGAVAFARARAAEGARRPAREIALPDHERASALDACDGALAELLRDGAPIMAPGHAVRAIREGLAHGFDAGSQCERELFAECVMSIESRALRYLFFAERQAAKAPGVARSTALEARRVAIVGGGARGRALAAACGEAGFDVTQRPADVDFAIVVAERALENAGVPALVEIIPSGSVGREGIAAVIRVAKRAGGVVVVVRGESLLARLRARCRREGHPPGAEGLDSPRMSAALADEGARALRDGIVERAGDVDVVACHGLGFPRFRGGPMFHAASSAGTQL